MQASQTPTRVTLAFATNGTKNTIPAASQIGVTPGAASLNDGFPPLTFTPIAAGGVPPAGADFNGILNLLSQTIRWQNAGGLFGYNAAFATDANVGGYPRGALLLRSDQSGAWLNQTDNNTTNPDTGGAGWAAAFMSGIVGQARNVAMSVATAGATGSLTADEIVVSTALGGQKFVLGGFNKTINLGTIGAGGLDVAGNAPANGFVAIYAIYNPTTGASALLATNATSAKAPEVYGGGAMPSGYTASALVSIAPIGTTAAQFLAFTQVDRRVGWVGGSLVSGSTFTGGPAALVSTSLIPLNAKRISGTIQIANASGSAASSISISVSDNGTGGGVCTLAQSVPVTSSIASSYTVAVTTPQAIFRTSAMSGGTPSHTIGTTSFEF